MLNFGIQDYWPYSRENAFLDTSIENCLKELSHRYNVALVAGLIEKGDSGGLGYSTACLIDRGLCHVLSRKSEIDWLVDYQPYPGIYNKALPHRGVCIAALICMDASSNPVGPPKCKMEAMKRFCDRAAAIKNQVPKGQRVAFCIPSRMEQTDTAGVFIVWSELLSDSVVILANWTARTNRRSAIQPEGTMIYCACRGGNTLRIVSWPKADIRIKKP